VGILKNSVVVLISGILLSSCGSKVNICHREFSQGQELPLNYAEIDKGFLSDLKEHTNADRNDVDYANKLYFGDNRPMYKVAAYWSAAGLGSNGDRVFVKDTKLIQEIQESDRWLRFEQTGLCKLMR
jgi:hypothetical protein